MARPLVEITTTQARYEYQVMRARLELSQERKPVENRKVSRASTNMRRQAGRLEMNNVRRRSDMSTQSAAVATGRSTVDRLATLQQPDIKTVQSAAESNYSEYGSAMARTAGGNSVNDSVWGQSMQHSQGDLVLVPVSPVDIHYIPASLAGDFEPGEMSANWNVGKARLDFVPPSFSMNFTQYASVSFEYTGGFTYVPPSADPNYEGRA